MPSQSSPPSQDTVPDPQSNAHDDPQEILQECLTASGKRMTAQRKILLDAFMRQKGHLSAEEFYRALSVENPELGQATVYRNLRLFTQCGLAEAIDFGDGVTRYEPSLGRSHHDHLICEVCGRSVEFHDEQLEAIKTALAESHGFTLKDHTLFMHGVCAACRQSADEKTE